MPHQRVIGFLLRFGLKTGIDFVHSGLESGWVFWRTTGVCEHFHFQLQMSKKEREILYANSK